MEIKKYHANQVLHIIRHNMRALPTYGNSSIVPELVGKNEELISRGKTPEEVNEYRKNLEKEIFKYNRKNLVHAVSVVIQCPDDCPAEEEEKFFQVCYQFWVDRLPMGERCIIQAVIHRDEIVKNGDGKRISHNHLHLSFVPAVPDTKHAGYAYRLNADQLTNRPILKRLHPELQKWLDAAGVHATVYSKRDNNGHTLKLSIADLKKITEITGGSFTGTVTVEDLADLINTALEQEDTIKNLTHDLTLKDQEIKQLKELLSNEKSQHEKEVMELKDKITDTAKALEESTREREKLERERKIQSQESPKRIFSWRSNPAKAEKEQEVTL